MTIRLVAILLLPTWLYSQTPESVIRGTIVSYPMETDSVVVINKSRHAFIYSNAQGNFSIAAKVGDTLVFSGTNFYEKSLVLLARDFHETMVVTLESKANALDEVKVSRYSLTGDLSRDSKNIKIEEEFKIDVDFANLPEQSIDNTRGDINFSVMPVMESQLTGIDFLKIGGTVVDMLGIKSKPNKVVVSEDFLVAIGNRFSDDRLTQISKIEPDKLILFLNYCDANSPKDVDLFSPQNELLLIEYLVQSAEEFRKLK